MFLGEGEMGGVEEVVEEARGGVGEQEGMWGVVMGGKYG